MQFQINRGVLIHLLGLVSSQGFICRVLVKQSSRSFRRSASILVSQKLLFDKSDLLLLLPDVLDVFLVEVRQDVLCS